MSCAIRDSFPARPLPAAESGAISAVLPGRATPGEIQNNDKSATGQIKDQGKLRLWAGQERTGERAPGHFRRTDGWSRRATDDSEPVDVFTLGL
ncbi:unnamed protein product, partial [Iphiclides podalirius]